jgi:TRAP-type C4-dicarboxylate transport system permease small subunit
MSAAPPSPTDDQSPTRERAFRVEEAVGAAAMAIISLISIANVVARYATNVSFAFTEEVSVFLLVVLTFVGAALAFATDDHIRITVLVRRLGPWGRRVCHGISVTASALLFGVLAYYGAILAWEEYVWGETSPALGLPSWIYTVWLPLLALVILLRVLAPLMRWRPGSRP